VISFTPSPCVAPSDFSKLEAKQGHAKSAKAATLPSKPHPCVSVSTPTGVGAWRPLRAKARPGNAGRKQSVLQSPIPNNQSPITNPQSPISNLPFRSLRPLREPISFANPKFKIKNQELQHPRRPAAAFTLVELLAVIGIMGLLAAVGVPALKGLTGSGGRKQALSQLMGALEIARNTAISTGTNAAVIFPDLNFASKPYRYRSMAVISWDTTNSTNGGPGTNPNVMLGSWITLPQGIVFHDKQINQLPTVNNKTSLQIPPITSNTIVSNLRAIVFQSDGGLEEYYYTNTLTTDGIAFYEGAVVSDTTTINSSKQKTNVETITMTRYTGRTIPTLARPQ